MRLLVTRPQPDGDALAARLAALGIESVVAPLMTVAPVPDAAADLGGVQALLFTSANGVRAFAHISPERGLPVFAVGDATARAAREAGFAAVESAGGDTDDLVNLVTSRLDPAEGALFHAAGRDVAGDLKGALESAGFTLRRTVLYRAEIAAELPEPAARALGDLGLDGVLLFSPRTATTFVSLVAAAGLTSALADITAYCLSGAVAAAAQGTHWGSISIAPRPELDALLEVVAEDQAAQHDLGAD
jgi:uroporphyrinogen-III synthase